MTDPRPHDRAPARAPDTGAARSGTGPILRFQRTERLLHWALALPYVLLYATAGGLALTYAEAPPRAIHAAFGWAHRAVGVVLIALPPLALVATGAGWRMHVENLREGWRWTADDFRWLVLFPRAAVDSRVKLPEQGKFNAAEKLNFMMVSATYPFYIVTGLLVWSPGVAVVEYLLHLGAAILGLPLVLGHIFMATVNPDTKVGLTGMITGWVDREWARHHYARWYRDRIERPERERAARELAESFARPAHVRCGQCQTVSAFGSWRDLVTRTFRVEPLFCPACDAELPLAGADRGPEVARAIVTHLETGRAEEPFAAEAGEAA